MTLYHLSRLFQNETNVVMFAQQLVSIAKYYKFDGWLITIENAIHVSIQDRDISI